MTNQNTLQALAERCKQATGPDRELDARIYILISGGSAADADYAATDPDVTCNPPPYTASLDAAVTLLPDGWGWAVSTTGNLMPCAYGHSPDKAFWVEDTYAVTVALAVCAFTFRARAAMEATP